MNTTYQPAQVITFPGSGRVLSVGAVKIQLTEDQYKELAVDFLKRFGVLNEIGDQSTEWLLERNDV